MHFEDYLKGLYWAYCHAWRNLASIHTCRSFWCSSFNCRQFDDKVDCTKNRKLAYVSEVRHTFSLYIDTSLLTSPIPMTIWKYDLNNWFGLDKTGLILWWDKTCNLLFWLNKTARWTLKLAYVFGDEKNFLFTCWKYLYSIYLLIAVVIFHHNKVKTMT